MRQVLICFLLILVSINISDAGTRHPEVSDQQHIEYGKKFKCVAKIRGIYKNNEIYEASAVVIRPRIIVTAAHIVSDSKQCFLALSDNESILLQKIVIHKDFEESIFGHNDIAIGFLHEDFKLDFYPDLYTDKDEVGKVSAISGFGIVGTFETGSSQYDGQRRAGSNKIESIDKNLLICKPDNAQRTSLEFLIANGDSGGGLFINKKLAGINSCIIATDSKTDSSYSDESGHTRVSDYIDWIEEVIAIESHGLDTGPSSATIVLNTTTK